MITIQTGKMLIPEEERFVGFAGDNQSNTKQFFLPGVSDSDSVYTLYLRFDDDTVSSAALSPAVNQDGLTLTWRVSARHLLKPGIVMAQLRIADGSGRVAHSGCDYFIVSSSAEFAGDGDEPVPISRDEFEERMAEAVREAKETAPYIGTDGYWYIYSSQAGEYVRSFSASGMIVDSAVSASSANPVENRAVKAYVDSADSLKVDKTTTIAGLELNENISPADLAVQLMGNLHPTYVVPGTTFGYTGQYASTPDDPPDNTRRKPMFCTGMSRWIELAKKSDVPAKTSDLTNDSGFLTAHQDISGKADIADIPTKTSDLTNDSGFLTAHQDISGKADIADIPTKTSDLTNDSGFLTAHQDISGKADSATTLSGYGITDAYTKTQVDALIPTVPTKTSDLTNDSGFLTSHQDISGKADSATTLSGYGITDAYTKTQVDALIPTVPTKTSDLTNDSGFLTSHRDISGKMDLILVDVPAASGQTAPDYTSALFTGLSVGQLFICHLSGLVTYWVKVASDSALRIARYSELPDISGKANSATTLAGYGITDAYTKTQADGRYAAKATTLSGYGITNAYTKSEVDGIDSDIRSDLTTYVDNNLPPVIPFRFYCDAAYDPMDGFYATAQGTINNLGQKVQGTYADIASAILNGYMVHDYSFLMCIPAGGGKTNHAWLKLSYGDASASAGCFIFTGEANMETLGMGYKKMRLVVDTTQEDFSFYIMQ